MWRLKVSEGGSDGSDRRLTSVNNHIGRQYWEFYRNLGTPEERAQVEEARLEFRNNRFRSKHSSDLLMRLQVRIYTSSCTYQWSSSTVHDRKAAGYV